MNDGGVELSFLSKVYKHHTFPERQRVIKEVDMVLTTTETCPSCRFYLYCQKSILCVDVMCRVLTFMLQGDKHLRYPKVTLTSPFTLLL